MAKPDLTMIMFFAEKLLLKAAVIGRIEKFRDSLWLGALSYVVSLTCALLLAIGSARSLAVGLLIMAVVPAVIAWERWRWPLAARNIAPTRSRSNLEVCDP